MAELHVYAEFARWCPACKEWMGWRDNTAHQDFFTPKFTHANCEAPYPIAVPPAVVVPRISIHEKSRERVWISAVTSGS